MINEVIKVASLIGLLFINSCTTLKATRSPDLFVNEKYKTTSAEQRESDIKYCVTLADEYAIKPQTFWNFTKSVFYNALVGAAPGAVGGTIVGDTAQNTAVGAAVGAVIGIIFGIQKLYEDRPYYQRFVEHCLHKKEYEIVGWK